MLTHTKYTYQVVRHIHAKNATQGNKLYLRIILILIHRQNMNVLLVEHFVRLLE